MRKILILVGILFLFSVNTTIAEAPTKPQIITDWQPVELLAPHPIISSVTPHPTKAPVSLKPPVPVAYTKTVAGAKAYALDQLGSVQFDCINKLFIKESNWNPFDLNKSSGAYGIPQALPGSKMATSGADWRTNPITQVKWGIKYIKARYGTACSAWRHSQIYGWY